MKKAVLLQVVYFEPEGTPMWGSPLFRTRQDLDRWMSENRPTDEYEQDIETHILIEY